MLKQLVVVSCVVVLGSCAAPEGKGLMASPEGSGAQVRFDPFHRPLPEIPLPNDFATRFDASSPTKRRINASTLAPTEWEKAARTEIDALDGWGTYQTVSVGFDKPLDLLNIVRRHQRDDYDPSNDAVYVVDITADSPDYCQPMPLDMGEGNFPLTLERPNYYPNDRNGDQW
ncbi:MAG: hypothetical protein JNG84_12695, partial [Archangium sp.]|nr:hypothetical protein [Archangium sp.]